MELVGKGAEANIYRDCDKLLKRRVVKKYRILELDASIRKARTRREAKILERLEKIGVDAPRLVRVDEKKSEILMEYVDGILVKSYLEHATDDELTATAKKIGAVLGILHDNNIIHNDMTTSNMILCDGRVFLIDFGLSYHSTRLEDRAMDLVVLKKSLRATHPLSFKVLWRAILVGYCGDPEVLSRVDIIEKRVRYK